MPKLCVFVYWVCLLSVFDLFVYDLSVYDWPVCLSDRACEIEIHPLVYILFKAKLLLKFDYFFTQELTVKIKRL